MSLLIRNFTRARIQKKALQDIYKNFLRLRKLHKNTEVSLAFLGETRMRKLNRKYRQKDYATDILSFSYAGNKRKAESFLGEIVICPAKAKLPIPVLFAHGLAHFSGYTHQTEAKTRSMQRFEREILESVDYSQ